MSKKIDFDWTKFLMGLLSALMGALTASAAVAAANASPMLIA